VKRLLCAVVGLLMIPSLAGASFRWDRGLVFESEDPVFRLRTGALLQPRYEYESRESDGTDHSSFSVQRARLKIGGYAYTEHLHYGLQMELAGNTNLLDAWIEYRRFDPIRMRMGQFTAPFNRERDIGVGHLLGTERSLASGEFEWPGGRDVGLMVSRQRAEGLEYRVGLFGGEGRNTPETSSNGMLISGRATYVFRGEYEPRETFTRPREGMNLSAGLGALYAHRNAIRNWFTGNGVPAAPSDTANVAAGTLDVQVRKGFWNLSGAFFHREIEHDAGTQPRFDGSGYSVSAGHLLVPEVLFLTARHSQVYPNRNNHLTRARSYRVALHLFQKGHRSQTRFETGVTRRRVSGGWNDDEFFRLQQQLGF